MDPSALIGRWSLIAAVAVDAQGQQVGPLFGTNPSGHLTYAADGTMEVTLCAGGEGTGHTPWGETAPAEYSYAGTYGVRGDLVYHRVIRASDPHIIGRILRRSWCLQGDQLQLSWRLPNARQGRIFWRVGNSS